ncbi:hypothetical protein RI129_007032 [Pyrocoelia pectoralis]|uniref:UDP-glucuronosyltransferase n=1 Tax=Pyrocoelia pectoralis TaxID=417401 RepID=A0AAN7ZGQ8_9COLE
MNLLSVISIVLTLNALGRSYNILAVFPYDFYSHFQMYEVIMKELIRQNHKVTVVGQHPLKEPLKNYTDIALVDTSQGGFEIPHDGEGWSLRHYTEFFYTLEVGQYHCEVTLKSPALLEFLKTDEKFDLIILEYFAGECFLGLAHIFKVPVIGIASQPLSIWHNNKFRNPSNPSYIPNNFLQMGKPRTFVKRLKTTLLNIIHQMFYDYYIGVKNQKAAEEVFGRDLPLLSDISQNISLFFANSHFSITSPTPMVPGVIEIAGAHIGSPKKLPRHIEMWINESDNGVVYFSMGSLIRADTLSEKPRDMFINAFRRIPQRVLWKWENGSIPDKPDNVMIEKWMPQFDILSHPNVKAFVTHGGIFGISEALHCGVPMLIIPIYGDQHGNAESVEENGGGIYLPYENLSEETIYDALTKVLVPKFNMKAKELSARFKDRPLSPLRTIIYWIEYVIRHHGAPHLKTAAVGMPLYKYLLLDVIAFLLLIMLIFMFAVYYVIKSALRILLHHLSCSAKLKKN